MNGSIVLLDWRRWYGGKDGNVIPGIRLLTYPIEGISIR
jgi:hypothetical protein